MREVERRRATLSESSEMIGLLDKVTFRQSRGIRISRNAMMRKNLAWTSNRMKTTVSEPY